MNESELKHDDYSTGIHGNLIDQPNNNCFGACYSTPAGPNGCVTISISVGWPGPPNPGVNLGCNWTF